MGFGHFYPIFLWVSLWRWGGVTEGPQNLCFCNLETDFEQASPRNIGGHRDRAGAAVSQLGGGRQQAEACSQLLALPDPCQAHGDAVEAKC